MKKLMILTTAALLAGTSLAVAQAGGRQWRRRW